MICVTNFQNCHKIVNKKKHKQLFNLLRCSLNLKSQFCQMFEKLKIKWGVNGFQLFLILITFATGGSACGYLSRKVLGLCEIENKPAFVSLYILLITLLWPICVIIISIPLGQYRFFSGYLKRVGKRIFGKK